MLCEVLEVGRSGFYDYVQRCKTGGVDAAELRVLARVKAIHAETGQSYGSRRMAKQLQDEGFLVGRWKARRLMQQAGVSVRCRTRRRPPTTDSRHSFRVAANLLERQFDVDILWTACVVQTNGSVTFGTNGSGTRTDIP